MSVPSGPELCVGFKVKFISNSSFGVVGLTKREFASDGFKSH